MNNILVTKEVSKQFGKHTALNKISLEIPTNSIYGLLGPNGAGKTTLIRIINQITYPDTGGVFFNGEPLQPQHIAKIGYLPEERGLYRGMKVGEQVLYLAQLKGMTKTEAKKRLNHWFDRLDIGDWWNRKVQELSKGMAQKIQFIVTVLHKPRLLIFDEPFSGFDPINVNIIKKEILQLKERGATIIFSTHRMESVEELCDYIALIHNSEKILDGKLADIKKVYRENIFEVSLGVDNYDVISQQLIQKFKIKGIKFNDIEKQLDFTIKLPSRETNDFFAQITSIANINRFVEKTPSVNDIFIQSIQNKNIDE